MKIFPVLKVFISSKNLSFICYARLCAGYFYIKSSPKENFPIKKKSSPEYYTIVCNPWTAVYPRFSARRKLDRHSFVSQCFSWFLCPNLKLDLSVSVSRKYAMQYSPRTWETNTYDADQFIRCRTAHWFHFYRYSKDWSVCLSVGHACQSDSDLRSGMDQSVQDARTPEAVCIASFIHSYRTYVKSVQNTLCSKHFT